MDKTILTYPLVMAKITNPKPTRSMDILSQSLIKACLIFGIYYAINYQALALRSCQ